ncbi:putative acetyltransferase, GNAT family [Biscogniauxia sp. FL1348]|nr:putative acetyltransferase, GNAT family [Biscogniauxia sp. FL1348]
MPARTPNPLGPIVGGSPAQYPSHDTILTGRYVTLVGLAPEHADALYPHVCGEENAHLWDYMLDGPFDDPAAFRASISAKSASSDPVFYAILPRDASGSVLGHASLMRADTAHRSVEIGHVLLAPALQRTRAATEALYLLARHALDHLGFRRCEWKCHALNAPSRRAALRLGFAFEGLFRSHMVVKGRDRDTAWYALLRDGGGEWLRAKEALEAWLDPANFDEQGVQRRRLEELRGVVS